MKEYSEGYNGAIEDVLDLLKNYDGKTLDREKLKQEIIILLQKTGRDSNSYDSCEECRHERKQHSKFYCIISKCNCTGFIFDSENISLQPKSEGENNG